MAVAAGASAGKKKEIPTRPLERRVPSHRRIRIYLKRPPLCRIEENSPSGWLIIVFTTTQSGGTADRFWSEAEEQPSISDITEFREKGVTNVFPASSRTSFFCSKVSFPSSTLSMFGDSLYLPYRVPLHGGNRRILLRGRCATATRRARCVVFTNQ